MFAKNLQIRSNVLKHSCQKNQAFGKIRSSFLLMQSVNCLQCTNMDVMDKNEKIGRKQTLSQNQICDDKTFAF